MDKKREIYLDHASTTPIDEAVLNKMLPYLKEHFGNASTIYSQGQIAHKALESARSDVAGILGARPERIIFTGSGTESTNLAVFGVARSYKSAGKHIIVSKIEHKAVLEPARGLQKQGFEVTYLSVDKHGLVDLEELKESLREDTILVSVIYANNEVGVIQPIGKIAKAIMDFRDGKKIPVFHSDACQAAGALSLNASQLGVDLMTLNASKIYGPKGVGCLYFSERVKLNPTILGGGQEFNMRSGTENVAAIVGFAQALKLAEYSRKKESERLTKLRDYFIREIQERIQGTQLNGHKVKRLPNNISMSFEGIEGESLMLMLDEEGISVSTGSACASDGLKTSHVLSAVGVSKEHARGSVRFTLGRESTKNDLDYVLEKLIIIVEKLRKISTHTL